MTHPRPHITAAAAAGAVALIVYLATAAPSLTFWDSGEFVTSAATLGIPHPPGSPLLMLAGRVLSLLPIPDVRGGWFSDPAFRVNMSGVLSGAALAFMTVLVLLRFMARGTRLTGRYRDDWPYLVSAVVAALLVAFSHQVWTNAGETETYLPSLLLAVTALWCVLRWRDGRDDSRRVRWLFLAAYLVGLGTGIHLSTVLVVPSLALLVILTEHRRFNDPAVWAAAAGGLATLLVIRNIGGAVPFMAVMILIAVALPALIWRLGRSGFSRRGGTITAMFLCMTLFGAGYSVYTTVAVRAAKSPAVNSGDPDSAARYEAYLSRDQYDRGAAAPGIFERTADTGYQYGYMYLRYLLRQFPAWGPTPTVNFTRPHTPVDPPGSGPITAAAPFPVLLAALVCAGAIAHARRDPRGFATLALYVLITSVGLVLYLNFENPETRERGYFFMGSYWSVLCWTGFGALAVLSGARRLLARSSRSHLSTPVCAALALVLLTTAPAAVLSRRIDPPNTAWHIHDRGHNLIALDYGHNILASCPEDAILFAHGDNDTYCLWYQQEVLGFRRDVAVINLSLLHGPWYIRQLRERGVPVTLTDDYIDSVIGGASLSAFRERLWPVEGREITRGGITWTMPPSETIPDGSGGRTGVLGAPAIMTAHIVGEAAGTRPVCFTVAVPYTAMIGLERHMATRGMVFELTREVSVRRYHFDIAALERALFDDFRFRGIADPSVYRDATASGLLRNYYLGFLDLCEAYLLAGDTDRALLTVRTGNEICAPDRDRLLLLASMLDRYGLAAEATDALAGSWDPDDVDDAVAMGSMLLSSGASDTSAEVFRAVVGLHPKTAIAWQGLIAARFAEARFAEALALLESMAAALPNDPTIPQLRSLITQALTDSATDEGGP